MPFEAHFEPLEITGRYLTNPELLAVNQVRQRGQCQDTNLAAGSHCIGGFERASFPGQMGRAGLAGGHGRRLTHLRETFERWVVRSGPPEPRYFAFDAPFPFVSHYVPALALSCTFRPCSFVDGTGAATANITVAWSTLGPTMRSDTAVVRDVWKRKDLGLHDRSFSAEVLGHGVEIIRVTPK